MSSYGFARQTPLNRSDPLGLSPSGSPIEGVETAHHAAGWLVLGLAIGAILFPPLALPALVMGAFYAGTSIALADQGAESPVEAVVDTVFGAFGPAGDDLAEVGKALYKRGMRSTRLAELLSAAAGGLSFGANFDAKVSLLWDAFGNACKGGAQRFAGSATRGTDWALEGFGIGFSLGTQIVNN